MKEAIVLAERIVNKLNEAIADQRNQICAGGAADYAQYTYLIGGLEALETARESAKEQYRRLYKELIGEDPDDE